MGLVKAQKRVQKSFLSVAGFEPANTECSRA